MPIGLAAAFGRLRKFTVRGSTMSLEFLSGIATALSFAGLVLSLLSLWLDLRSRSAQAQPQGR